MIDVLNIISDTNIGGAGNVLLNFLKSYDKDKFKMSVAMPAGGILKQRIEPLGVTVYDLGCIRDKSFDIPAIAELKKLIRRVNPDIVHTHGALSGRIAAKQCGKPVVFTRHSAFTANPVFTKGVGRAFFKFINERYADRIIAVSSVCRDDLISCGIAPGRIDTILNGSPPVDRLSNEERFAVRKKYGVSPEDFLAGIVARIEPYKGQMFVVEAARILKDEGRKFKIIIAGTGGYEDDVKRRAVELGLSENLIFPGFVSDTGSLMNILDVQINASYVEATSLSLLEGMSIGLPAIASNESGNPWVIRDGENGFLFKSRDSRSLAEKIAFFQDSCDLRRELSEKSINIYKNEFSCERFAESIEATYLKTMEAYKNGK